jgi:radical SAM protein with 4Fe4S-binding SPASM domain
MTQPKGRLALTVELTSFCNQRCRHCYNAFDHSNVQALVTDELLALLTRALSEVPFERVTFCGGEPFAHDGIFAALELCGALGVPAYIASNGTLMTDEIARRLASFGSTVVQVPLNGPVAEVHDASVGLSGAWKRAVRGIKLLRQHGVVVNGCIVITRRNAALVGATLERMRELGMASAALSRLLAGGVAAQNLDLLPTRSDLLEALRQANDSRFHDMQLRVAGPMPPCMVNHRDFPSLRFGWCSVGSPVQEFVLGPDGRLRLCIVSEAGLGDARKQSFADLVRVPEVTTFRHRAPAFCRGCPALPSCLGGCAAAALAATGDSNALDPLVLQHVDASFASRVRAARSP